jgi:hypothetical protein
MDRSLSVRTPVGIRFPLAVFAVWRVLQGIVVLAFGGSLRGTTFAWDGGWYLSVLRLGYDVPPGGYSHFSNVPFFPGLAWATQMVQVVVPDETAATLLVANGLALTAFVAVWGAVRAWVGEDMARRVTVALALFPTSYFLWMYYTEGLLLSAAAAAVWAGRRERHTLAAVLLALASTARLVGVTVGPALALARIVRMRRVDAVSVRYVLGSAVGLAAVMVRQAIEIGDPLGFLHGGQAWDRTFAGPWMALYHAGGLVLAALPGLPIAVVLDVVAVLLFGALVVLLWQGARRGAWPLEAATMATPLWFVPICSQLIASQARYMMACWPALLVVADAWPRLPRAVRIAVLGVPAVLTVVMLGRLSQGLFND